MKIAKSKNGRAKFKAIAHEIHSDNSQYNSNGISWSLDEAKKALQSAIGMPVDVEFAGGGKKEISSHGFKENFENNGKGVFENATTIGFTDNAYIETIDGKNVLAIEGFLNENSYKEFVDQLRENLGKGSVVNGSISIADINGGFLKYAENTSGNGAKKASAAGRVPKDYAYIQYAILGVEPADKAAKIIEVNQKENITEGKKMEKEAKGAIEKIEELYNFFKELNEKKIVTNSEQQKQGDEQKPEQSEFGKLKSQVEEIKKSVETLSKEFEKVKGTEKSKTDGEKDDGDGKDSETQVETNSRQRDVITHSKEKNLFEGVSLID
jgi:hypothetical protein